MAFTTLKNGLGSGISSYHASATSTLTFAEIENTGETLAEVSICGVYWSGSWSIVRDGVTVLSLSGSGFFDLVSCPITINATDDIVATLTGTGTLILKLHKVSRVISSQYDG